MTTEVKKDAPSLEGLTDEQIEAVLKARKEKKRKEQEKLRTEYEGNRENLVQMLLGQASDLSSEMGEFKKAAHEALKDFGEQLEKYGDLRKNSKGGFQLVSEDGRSRVKYTYRVIHFYDERAQKAEELLKDFLSTTVKKRDKALHDIIMSLLQRNKKGQLEFSRINQLYAHENSYDDPRWREALKLFKESFKEGESKYDIYFQEKDDEGVWQNINLTFNSLKGG